MKSDFTVPAVGSRWGQHSIRINRQLSGSVGEELFAVVRTIISGLLQLRRTEKEVAELLCVSPSQAKLSLQWLVDEGAIEKTKRPSGYSLKRYN